jgi:mitochondrial fission protein ELM1
VTPASRSCWIITPGEAGFESQARGLATALEVEPAFRRVKAKVPWRWFPGAFWLHPLRSVVSSEPLVPPWPDLVISCGRVAAPVALAIKRASGEETRVAHIQHPHMPLDRFDIVIAPRHDGIDGPNVIVTTGAIHPVTKAALADGARRWQSAFAALPRPLIGALIGGSNGRYRLDEAGMEKLARTLAALAQRHDGSLAITPSRRTGAANESVLRARLQDTPAFLWDGRGDNPYLGILALADVLVVTEDSVSMTSEAVATGKPVYVARLRGRSRRQRQFHEALIAAGYTRPLDAELATWRYTPPDDTARAAAACRRRFGWS